MHNSFSHGASLSPKQPKHDRWRYLSVSAALWIWLDLVYPCSPTGGPYPPNGPGRTGGTRVYPPLCGSGWPVHTSFSHGGIPIPQVAQVGTEELRCIHRYVGMPGTCVSSLSHGASLSPKRPTQDRGDSSVSAAVWELVDLVYPRPPAGRPHHPSGPGRTGGTRLYPPLCGSGWPLCILVLPLASLSSKRLR